jgi:lipoprotein-anchoring transpeptidase ErfK/SrfK
VPLQYAHYIVIVVHEYKLYYYEHGVLVRSFIVALGRPGYPTPLGYFHIYAKRKPAGGALGACAMYYYHQGAIAIHGTNEPWLLSRPVPRNFSHGCARMHNRDVLWLYARVPVGTKVHNLR